MPEVGSKKIQTSSSLHVKRYIVIFFLHEEKITHVRITARAVIGAAHVRSCSNALHGPQIPFPISVPANRYNGLAFLVVF